MKRLAHAQMASAYMTQRQIIVVAMKDVRRGYARLALWLIPIGWVMAIVTPFPTIPGLVVGTEETAALQPVKDPALQ